MRARAVMFLLALLPLMACGSRDRVPPRAPPAAADAGGIPADAGAQPTCDPRTDPYRCCVVQAIPCPGGRPTFTQSDGKPE
jgi:hypothetical protein